MRKGKEKWRKGEKGKGEKKEKKGKGKKKRERGKKLAVSSSVH